MIKLKKVLSLFLALVMVLGMVCTTALADGVQTEPNTIPDETTTGETTTTPDETATGETTTTPSEKTTTSQGTDVTTTENTNVTTDMTTTKVSTTTTAPTAHTEVQSEEPVTPPAEVKKPFKVGEETYATLQDANDAAAQITGATITIADGVDEITLTEESVTLTVSIQITHTVTINGNGCVITRGEDFKTKSDPVPRSWYNPAMIEVHGGATLTLENITLDDDNRPQGTKFTDNSGEAGDHTTFVQDAMIATYSGDGNIVLGNGAELKNFGGMSAVRITGAAATFTMKAGSSIVNGGTSTESKTSGTGAAGAVWLQGGTFTMEAGSEISGVTGRAVYADGSDSAVNIGGTISSITANTNMWQGTNGVAIHLRSGATATVSGTIDKVTGGGITIFTESCDFTLEKDGEIKNCKAGSGYGALIDANHGAGPNATTVINGKITNCEDQTASAFIYYCNAVNGLIIGKDAVISGNTCKNLIYDNSVPDAGRNNAMVIRGTITDNTVSGCILYGGNNGRPVELYGKINGNHLTGKGDVVGFGTNRRVTMYEGSEIKNNDVANGAVVAVNGEGNCFTMNGGEISGNKASQSVFRFTSGSWNQGSTFEINGGTVSGNIAPHVLTISGGGKIPGINSYLLVPEFDNTVYFDKQVHWDSTNKADVEDYCGKLVTVDAGTKLGNANRNQNKYAWPDQSVGSDPRSVAELNKAAKTYGLKDAFATMWAQNADGTPVTVTMDTPAETDLVKFDLSKAVYVLAQAVDDKGKPAENAEVFLIPATVENGVVKFDLPGNENGYAVGLTQLDPDAQKGILELKVDKDEVFQSGIPTELTYTATFTPNETIADGATYTATLNGQSAAFENNTVKGKVTLDSSSFKAGGSYNALAVLTVTVGGQTYKVLSNTVSTKMTGLRDFIVTFDSNSGSAVASQTVKEGATATKPTDPTRSGYTFNGWRIEGATSNYDFNTPVTADITLVAQWTSNGGGGTYTPPTTNIEDENPPLANVDGLNLTDHFSYVAGYPDGTVRPEANITRAEAATIFFRLMTEEYRVANWATTNDFPDVKADEWYNVAISVAAKAGIVKGYPDGTFKPDEPITRAEFATMAARFMTDDVTDDVGDFDDTVGHWAAETIRKAVKAGWVRGKSSTEFDPEANITRAEVVTMVNRMLDRCFVPDAAHMLDTMKTWPDNKDTSAWYYLDIQEAGNGHNYKMEENVETWTELVPTDWAAKEAEWVANNGASAKADEK